MQSRQDWSLGSLELLLWVVDGIINLLLIDDTREEVLISHNVEFLVRIVQDSEAVNVSKSHIILPDELLQAIDNLLNGTPSSDISSLESHELLLSVQYLPFLNDELRLINVRTSSSILVHSVSVLVY